jgi:hypothetical protein
LKNATNTKRRKGRQCKTARPTVSPRYAFMPASTALRSHSDKAARSSCAGREGVVWWHL